MGLPVRLVDRTDTHALRALRVHGHDVAGNLLVGEPARDRFPASPVLDPAAEDGKAAHYARLAQVTARGELPGSSAGGEQPKFTAWAVTPDGARHVIVKFSEVEEGPVSERWRDLLLAEHLALETPRETGIAAATTRIFEHGAQRFLEVERFDRVGAATRTCTAATCPSSPGTAALTTWHRPTT